VAGPCDGDVLRLCCLDLLPGAGALCTATLADQARRLDPSGLREDARFVGWQEHSGRNGLRVAYPTVACLGPLRSGMDRVPDVVPFPSCRRGAPFPISCIFDPRVFGFFGFVSLLLLVLLRFLLRRQWLAAVVFLLIVPAMVGRDFQLLPWVPRSAMLAALVILLVLLCFGVLAQIACTCCSMMLDGVPLSPNLSAWYAHATLVPLGFVAAITCYGLYAATYGRSLFQTEFPES